MPLLSYFIKTVLCSGALLAYYWLFLRNQRFHQYNRFYLLGTLTLSLTLPLFSLPILFNTEEKAQSIAFRVVEAITLPSADGTTGPSHGNTTVPSTGGTTGPSVEKANVPLAQGATGLSVDEATGPLASPGTEFEPVTTTTQATPLITWRALALLIYLAGMAWMAAALVRALWQLAQMRRRYPMMPSAGLRLYQTNVKGTPFSFFNSIFWNTQIDINSAAGQQIFRHELYHVKQLHSADTLLAELAIIACWFNPFFWLLKKELTTIHEFLADRHATTDGETASYAELLVVQAAVASNRSLPHYFSTSPIKRRIAMILSSKPTKSGYLSRTMALPVITILAGTLVVNAQKVADPIAQHKPAASKPFQLASKSSKATAGNYTWSQKPQQTGVNVKPAAGNKPVAPAKSGQEPTLELARQLQVTILNMKQVEEKLGAPSQIILSSDESVWTYASGGKMLRIQFNKKTDEIERFYYAQNGKPTKKDVQYEQVKAVQEDVTSNAVIEERFGKPTNIRLSSDEETWEYQLPNKQLKVNFHIAGSKKELVSAYAYTESNPASR